ncbi:hypothetical protein [Specibacter cremeus]|uniref:hypothetical protein n=1 Tax=Specibacter cremeus TaxID=1629051 RepID=UPI000F78A795|nr:hypothetical protein [Specibacter cremeus]
MTRLADRFLDFSRTLSSKERQAFEARRARLNGQFGEAAANATAAMSDYLGAPGLLATEGLRIRTPFCRLEKPIPEGEVSDRRAPKRALRPPATMISSSKGAALRVYLTALAAAQIKNRPGRRVTLDMPLATFSRERGWNDLVATPAVTSGRGKTTSTIREKKARTLHTALDTLEEAKLVHLPGTPGKRGRYEGFSLLDEAGWQHSGDPLPYTVPPKGEDYFALPVGFVTSGWLHVLEDSEITLLLMVACRRGTLAAMGDEPDIAQGEVAIPADVRLRCYGIHRDPFSTARKTLEWFKLLGVREMDRRDDGRAEDAANRLHRLSLLKDGFEPTALDVLRETIDRQLSRV